MLKKYEIMGLLTALLGGWLHQAQATEPAACYPREQVKQDLSELYKRLEAAHYNLYVNTSKEQYELWYHQSEQAIDDCMTESQVALLLQKFVSRGNVAHARIELPTHLYADHQQQGGKFLPVYVRSDGKRLWVAKNYSTEQDIKVGDQIMAINGVATDQLLLQLRPYLSADTDRMYGGFLEFYLGMLMWFEYGELQQFALTIKQSDSVVTKQVSAITAEQRTEMGKALTKTLELGWDRQAKMISEHVAYLRPGPFFNTEGQAEDIWDNSHFKSFIDQSFQTFKAANPSALLIDMRDNPGGDSSFSDLMMERIADQPFQFASQFKIKVSDEFKASNEQRLQTSGADMNDMSKVSVQYRKMYEKQPNGTILTHQFPVNQPHPERLAVPVFMLINRHSYSNAVTVAAMAQDYGFATILGEETSDLATTYGAMEHFKLQHTGIKVGFPKAYIVRPNGDETIRGVVPEQLIPTPMYEPEKDLVLAQALAHINKQLKSVFDQ